MNTSKLVAGVLLVLSLQAAAEAQSGLGAAGVRVLWMISATGQQQPSPTQTAAPPKAVPLSQSRATPADRREVEKLLSRARQAMHDGNLETADSLISRAEAMNVDFSLFHVGDTPKKARHDLEQRRKASRPENKRPSERFKPENQETTSSLSGGGGNGPAQAQFEPSLDRTTTPIMVTQASTDDASGLPGMDRKDDLSNSPFKRHATNGPPVDASEEADLNDPTAKPIGAAGDAGPEARRKSDSLLLAARRSLAQGDLRRASVQIEEAKKLNVAYGFHDDSPAKVETLIIKARGVEEVRANQPDSEAARRQYADLLMEQADQLIRWKEYDEAERLAMDAGRLKGNYGPFETRPESLLGRINAERRGLKPGENRAAAGAPLPGGFGRSPDQAGQGLAAPGTTGREQVQMLLTQSRAALISGDIDMAERFLQQAEAFRLPESAYALQDERPFRVKIEIQRARSRTAQNPAAPQKPQGPAAPLRSNQGVVLAGGPGAAAGGEPGAAAPQYPTTQAVYDPNNDGTSNQATSARNFQPIATEAQPPEQLDRLPPAAGPAAPTPPPPVSPGEQPVSTAMRLFQEGEQALRDRDVVKARERFQQAYAQRDQLDAVTAQRLQDHLQLLSGPQARSRQLPAPKNLMDDATAKQTLAFKQLSAEVAKTQQAARKVQEKDAIKSLRMLESTRATVLASEVTGDGRTQLLKRLDLSQAEVEKFIKEHKAQIEQDQQNLQIKSQVETERLHKLEIDDRLAKISEDFSRLIEERRFAEAEVLAKRAQEIAPNNPFSRQLYWVSKMARRNASNQDLIDTKEDAAWTAFNRVEEAAIPFDDGNPYTFGDVRKWKDLTYNRSQLKAQGRSRRSERELDIERKLSTPVSLQFQNKPLGEVLDTLAKLSDINLHLDPSGLQEEGIHSDTPISINLNKPITLKSALKLILEPLHLSYVIKDEVLKVTSEQLKDGEIFPVTYSVADLVIPIPNFVPSGNIGLQQAITDAQRAITGGSGGPSGFGGPAVMASRDGASGSGMINPAVLAQINQATSSAGGMRSPIAGTTPGGMGPGGLGGAQQADFDSLIDLITTTIAPTTWDEVGGPGSIAEFRTNLSLVISQTQEVHDQIADLLSQLRRLQDLQVTIEVRFITLNDNFFEQIGVDFNMNIENLDKNQINVLGHPTQPGAVVGLNGPGPGTPTTNLDIPFTQTSFTLGVPQFGQPTNVANFGFAILSDIEAYFLVNASQGDRRSNVLQAPKVTLFNGQTAFVSDTSQTPFVISVVPVVGDFAAAQQPVIVVLSEGTFMTVQAVVSADRRFVRLTIVPFFSQIGNVQEFTFQGSSSSNSTVTGANASDAAGDGSNSGSSSTASANSGITVQLPTFSFVTVTTTVSVPDGGTVLLGGVKRLSEGRNEFGVPILSKLPYINRLFKNVGIGRETQSLMMMVTPRIIIQEEEEERLGIQPPATGP